MMTEKSESTLIGDLRSSLLQNRQPLIVCGAGVSVAATDGYAPSWSELINSGISKIVALNANEDEWAAYARSRLRREDQSGWIDVADEITRKLGGTKNAEFYDWLKVA